jgi:predicted membrane channel-forming protein YqfA (hemolysin III family)
MEIVKVIWVINFFFFSMILFFVWSKIYIIAKRIKKATDLIGELDKVTEEPPATPPAGSGAKPA